MLDWYYEIGKSIAKGWDGGVSPNGLILLQEQYHSCDEQSV